MKFRLFLAIAAIAAISAARAAETPINELLRDALYSEEVTRDAEAAARQYTEVISRYETQRNFAATAIFRLAEVRRKQGRKEDAIKLYQQLIGQFPESEAQVTLAKENLQALGGKLPESAPVPLPDDADSRELARVKILESTSPDRFNANDLLVEAASKDYFRTVSYLAGKAPNLNSLGSGAYSGSTPLTSAAGLGNLAMCEVLLKAGANTTGTAWSSPLSRAVERNHKLVIDLLLQRKAEVNFASQDDGISILALAVMDGNSTLVDKLIALGADPNLMGDFQLAPLHLAIVLKNVELAKKLITAGANIELPAGKDWRRQKREPRGPGNPEIAKGETPLMLAVSTDSIALVELMLSKLEKPSPAAPDSPWAQQRPSTLSQLLCRAVERNLPGMAQWLLQHGADPRALTPDSTPIITRAVMRGNPELVKILLDAGADVNAMVLKFGPPPGGFEKIDTNAGLSEPYPPSRFSPLNTAITLKKGALKMTRDLIDAGAKPDDDWLDSLLHEPNAKPLPPGMGNIPLSVRNLLTERFVIPRLTNRQTVTLMFAPPGADLALPLTSEKSGTLPPGLAQLLLNLRKFDWPEIRYTSGSSQLFPTKIDVWRGRNDSSGIAWSGTLDQKEDFPPLFWGDVVRLSFDVRNPETLADRNANFQYTKELPDKIFWNLRKRISFPIKIDSGDGPKDFQMRGDRIAFDPTLPEVPLTGAGRLARLFSPPGYDFPEVVVTRKGWPDIVLKTNEGATYNFILEPDDVVKLRSSYDFKPAEIRKSGVTILAKGLPANRYFKTFKPMDMRKAAMPTLIQALADLTSASPLAEPTSQEPAEIVSRLFRDESVIPTLWLAPDFTNLRIRRLKEDDSEEILVIDLSPVISNTTDASTFEEVRKSDIQLQAGDIVEVTLHGDPDSRWSGLPAQAETFFGKALNGRVQVKEENGAISLREITYRALQFIQTDAGRLPTRRASGPGGTATMTPLGALGTWKKVKVDRNGKTFTDDGTTIFLKHGDKVEITQFEH